MIRSHVRSTQKCGVVFKFDRLYYYKTREKIENFWKKKGKTEICQYVQVENLEVFKILDDETDLNIGFVSQNLVAQTNFVEFRNSHNFMFFKASGVG